MMYPATRRLGAIVALLLHCSAWAQAPTDTVESIQTALRDHNTAQALNLARTALQQFPGDARLWTLQGAAYSGQGKNSDARASFQRALKIAPNAIPALHGAAQIEYEAGSAAGIPLLQHLLQLEPANLTTHGMLAVLAYQQGNCKLATVHFEKAGALFDRQAAGLNAYATCLMRLREFGAAVKVFQQALLLNPDDRRERQVLVALQLRAGQPKAAILTLGPLLQDTPDSQTLELAAAAHEDAHDTSEAVSLLREAILLDPHNVNLYMDFAVVSAAHQSNDVGIRVVTEGITLQPGAAPLYVARGVLFAQLDQYDNAEADFERAYELDPTQSLSAAAQGLAAMQKNDLDGALANIHEKLARKPNDPSLLYLQADILAQKGVGPGTPEFGAAVRSARKAIALRPSLGPAHGVMAKLYLRSGQYQAAASECREALKIDPKDQTSLYRLIQALRKVGDNKSTPALLKRLADLRAQSTQEERERNRYRLADDESATVSNRSQ